MIEQHGASNALAAPIFQKLPRRNPSKFPKIEFGGIFRGKHLGLLRSRAARGSKETFRMVGSPEIPKAAPTGFGPPEYDSIRAE